MYEISRFNKDTSWGALIDIYRKKMVARYTEILVDEYEEAYLNADVEQINRLDSKISWALRKEVVNGRYSELQRYLGIVESMDPKRVPLQFLLFLQDTLPIAENSQQVSGKSDNLLKTVEVLLVSRKNSLPDA
jgi:hypothetical protein